MIDNTKKYWWDKPAAAIDDSAATAAQARQTVLTKPLGSLGRLEDIAVTFAGWQGNATPKLDDIRVRVFAADHGICAQGVSAFPQVVTVQMIQNFVAGGAAISVLAKRVNADFAVVNVGTASPLIDTSSVIERAIAAGTQDFSLTPAMTFDQCVAAMDVGREMSEPCDLFIGGEMGIGNTTSAAAIFSALLDVDARQTVGRGTGIDDRSLQRKITLVERSVALHKPNLVDPVGILQCLGGFEIAALTGAYIANAQARIPNLIDGFISTAAALLAIRINPSVKPWCLLSHLSAEAGHVKVVDEFLAPPLLDFGMRLGEGSGAALVVPILQAALSVHKQMATFEDAKVSQS